MYKKIERNKYYFTIFQIKKPEIYVSYKDDQLYDYNWYIKDWNLKNEGLKYIVFFIQRVLSKVI
jgi:hypothetical protein